MDRAKLEEEFVAGIQVEFTIMPHRGRYGGDQDTGQFLDHLVVSGQVVSGLTGYDTQTRGFGREALDTGERV